MMFLKPRVKIVGFQRPSVFAFQSVFNFLVRVCSEFCKNCQVDYMNGTTGLMAFWKIKQAELFW